MEIQDWLTKKHMDFVPKETLPILLQKVKDLNIIKEYRLEEITEKFCSQKGKDIKLLRLQVSHSELNAIDFI